MRKRIRKCFLIHKNRLSTFEDQFFLIGLTRSRNYLNGVGLSQGLGWTGAGFRACPMTQSSALLSNHIPQHIFTERPVRLPLPTPPILDLPIHL